MRTPHSFQSAALLLAIILVLSGGVLPSSAQSATPSSDPAPTLTALHIVTPTNGWAVVTVPDTSPTRSSPINGMTYPGTVAYVLHTEDGGQSWANVSPSMPPSQVLPYAGAYNCDCSDNGFAGLSVLDDSHAWVMIDDAGFAGNQLFDGISLRKTSDAGQSWQDHVGAMNAPSVVTSTFIDSTHGWLLAGNLPAFDGSDQPALLYRTTDGVRWDLIADDGAASHGSNPDHADEPISTVETGITAMMHKDMAFESASSGWMLIDSPDSTDAHLLHTTDGGITWTRNKVLPEVNEDYCSLMSLKVSAPGGISFMAGCISGRYLYHSSDDGLTWQINPAPAYLFPFNGDPELILLNSTSGWALGCDSEAKPATCDSSAKPFLYKTADAGKTWSKIGALPDTLAFVEGDYGLQIIPQFDFIDDQTGWAIAPTGGLFSTRDGGKTWTAIVTSIPSLH